MSEAKRLLHPNGTAAEAGQVNGPVRLRRAVAEDTLAIEEIERACFTHPGDTFDRRRIRSLTKNPKAIVLVACDVTGNLLGWAVALTRRHRNGVTGRVYGLAVHARSRGMGLGRLLTERILKALRRRGVSRICLEVRADNLPAISLYRKLGFRDDKTMSHYYAKGVHALHMVLD